MAKTSIKVRLVTYNEAERVYVHQHVFMNIPEEAARIIKEAWTKEGEFAQSKNITSKFLCWNQGADALLYEDDVPVAGMLGMCCEEYNSGMTAVFKDNNSEEDDE